MLHNLRIHLLSSYWVRFLIDVALAGYETFNQECFAIQDIFPMKYFGTVKSFDEATGRGLIVPETGGEALGFDQSAVAWNRVAPPRAGQRLSYDLHHTNGRPNAVNLATI